MMLQPDGHLTSCDILHTVAAAIIFDVYENQDSRLVSCKFRTKCFALFPDRLTALWVSDARQESPMSNRPSELSSNPQPESHPNKSAN